jgi:hypothetical protein
MQILKPACPEIAFVQETWTAGDPEQRSRPCVTACNSKILGAYPPKWVIGAFPPKSADERQNCPRVFWRVFKRFEDVKRTSGRGGRDRPLPESQKTKLSTIFSEFSRS